MLDLQLMGRGEAWLDAGSHENLLDASLFVRSVERRQGLKIGCPEEIAWRKGWITNKDLVTMSNKYENNSYSHYLRSLPNELIVGV
jgi:glucose-1-phosphate thymidylyltransferase